MSDATIASKIESLVAEEQQLRSREAADSLNSDRLDADKDRLQAIEVELDRCWDLLRQRRGYDRGSALERQRELVGYDLERLSATARTLDEAIHAHRSAIPQKVEKMFEGFDNSRYEHEVRERWGHTEAYRQSTERTAHYGETEWAEIRAQAEQSVRDFAELMRAGEPASGERAKAAAERHRQHITRWFYECSPQVHRGLANLFVTDGRFERNYETVAEGLARYVHDSILANAAAQPALTS